MCLTNIDIVDGIDCLQVLQHSSGSNKYLTVNTGKTSWRIGDDIDGKGGWIASASAGGICPAQPSNSLSVRDGDRSWKYVDGPWKEEIINVKCLFFTTSGWFSEDYTLECSRHPSAESSGQLVR